MSQQHVCAEADHGAHRVGLPIDNGPIEIAGGDKAPTRRPERTIDEPQGRGHVLCRGKLLAGDWRSRRRREQHIAAAPVEAASKGIQQRHRARRLRHIGVLLMPAPGVIGRRPRLPD
jgi:hypothetical protein